MPRATIDPRETTRHELQTCEGGFIEVRRMSYGKLLDRQSEAMQMRMIGGSGEGAEADIKMMGRNTALLEFGECIVNHNLEDENGVQLNFKQPGIYDKLDPRIGEEIGQILDELNRFDKQLGK